jgi:hypothetical protein
VDSQTELGNGMSVQIASAQELIPKTDGLRSLFMNQNWSTGILPVGKTGVSPVIIIVVRQARCLHCPTGETPVLRS